MRAGLSFASGSAHEKEEIIREGNFSLPHLSRHLPVSITFSEGFSRILKGN